MEFIHQGVACRGVAAALGPTEGAKVMITPERDGIEGVLFGDTELLDFKCFRGDRTDVSEDDIKQQIHSAFMQRKMKQAVISADAPCPDVPLQNVREFVRDLESPV
jgi:hypothetical protein